ncbi:MAG: ParB/RepB/Spo0J family partition protein [Thermodesulfobacteriota bacterium]|nr:ParB/RepB/Spo0J family partition protein [Thermodesulfobacteriota bacterium]|tara:strand:- start:3659 stop:4507 length:849 start_codon:yes stop_codon:yes gene_type:complete
MKKSLGKGLDSLIRSSSSKVTQTDSNRNKNNLVFISDVEPNKNQPRKDFDSLLINDLAESIKSNGLLQPIIVREIPNNKYEIIAGERRWRASQIAGLTKVPVVVTDATDKKSFELSIIENLQREDLNSIEEALALKELLDKYSLTNEEILKITGKRRSSNANTIRLLELPIEVQRMIIENKLSRGHGIALLSLSNKDSILKVAEFVAKKGLSVRQTENLTKSEKGKVSKSNQEKDIYIKELIKRIEDKIGLKVKITGSSKSGKIEIKYRTLDELNKIISSLK